MKELLFITLLSLISCESNGTTHSDEPELFPRPTVWASTNNGEQFAAAGVRATFDLPELAHTCSQFLRMPASEQVTNVTGPDGGEATYFTTGDVVTIDFNGYVKGNITLDGVIFIDDIQALGTITQGGGTFIVDATLRMFDLEYGLGAGTFLLNTELAFRLENRELLEIFDLVLFEDIWIGAIQLKQGSRWLRYETDDELIMSVDTGVYSPEMNGVVHPVTDSFIYLNMLTGELQEGFITVRGAGDSFVEIEKETPTPSNFNCFFFGIGCGLEVRIEENGIEGFEATQTVLPSTLLP
jgi:hypothetical protein